MFSEKATKIEEIFSVDWTVCSKCQMDGEDFVNFCGLLRKHKLYYKKHTLYINIQPTQMGGFHLVDFIITELKNHMIC